MSRLILASASPRRQSLLREAGYEFDVKPADIDESAHFPALRPTELAKHLALTKAQAIAQHHPDDVVLAADTLVTFGERILGKPADADHAKKMLQLLAGTTHLVITGVAVVRIAENLAKTSRVISAVKMRALNDEEIDRYVASKQWEGKAGGYGIQDDDPFVTRMTGSHSNIVGLPMEETQWLLAEAGIHPARHAAG